MYRPPLWNGFAAAGCYAARVDRVVDNVCFGSGTEILMTSTDVRFTPVNDLRVKDTPEVQQPSIFCGDGVSPETLVEAGGKQIALALKADP